MWGAQDCRALRTKAGSGQGAPGWWAQESPSQPLGCGAASGWTLAPAPTDIYAIGVGQLDVDWAELNQVASQKDGEKHAFKLPDAAALRQVFEHMLGMQLPPISPRGWGGGRSLRARRGALSPMPAP